MSKNDDAIKNEGHVYIAKKYPFMKIHICRDIPLCLTNYYLITYYYDYYLLSILITFT